MRVNFLGGPGAGKSTTAADVFARLKRLGYSVEHVGEYVKSWAYGKRPVDPLDQFYLQAKQMQYEYRLLKAGVLNIVTDSPVMLGYIYAPEELKPTLQRISDLYDSYYPSFNIFLVRGDKPYIAAGRYQDRERAVQIDKTIVEEVSNLVFVPWDRMDIIMDLVLGVVQR